MLKKSGAADDFEKEVDKVMESLSGSVDLAGLYFCSAKEVAVSGGKKAAVIFVPFKMLKQFQKLSNKLVPELEKKLDATVCIVAQRTILSPSFTRKQGVKSTTPRPNSRTLTSVHDALLEDVVYPTEIVGKRTRYKTDGSKLIKILLDPKSKNAVEDKIDVLSTVYKKLTNKNVTFIFPVVNREEVDEE